MKRWKVIIVCIVAIALVLAVLATLMMSTEFTASARIQVNGDQASPSAARAPVEDTDSTASRDAFNTQYALLQARSIAVRVARSMKLAQGNAFFHAHGAMPPGGWLPANGVGTRLPPALLAEREQMAVELLTKHVSIAPSRGSALIGIRYTSRSPEWSAKVVNQWVRQFLDSSVERRFAATAGPRKFLETRLAQLRGQIEQADRKAALYASASGIVPLDPSASDASGKTLASSDFEALNDAYHKAMADRATAKSQMSASDAADAGNPVLTALRARRAEVEAEYARLSVRFKPAYPALVALAQERRSLDENIGREEKRARAAVHAQYADAQRLESSLREEMGASRSRLDRQSYAAIQYNVFRRETETNRQLYDGYLQRYKDLSVSDVGPADISVVDLADVPDSPSSPKLLRNLAIALLGGLLASAVVVLLLERNDESLREPGEMPDLLQIPLLGATKDLNIDNVQGQLFEPGSSLSEAYLKIATKLGATAGKGMPRSMMVTSTKQGEGKTISALAFALILARSGKKVALVDCDMRDPSLHALLHTRNEVGLSGFLSGEVEWKAIIQTLKPNDIGFLPAGPMPLGPAELLNSELLSTLVADLLKSFDHVVIDATPMLDLADAPLIARAVEGVVFVAATEGTGIRAIRAAITRLKDSGAHIFGGIVTKVSEHNRDYRYDTL